MHTCMNIHNKGCILKAPAVFQISNTFTSLVKMTFVHCNYRTCRHTCPHDRWYVCRTPCITIGWHVDCLAKLAYTSWSEHAYEMTSKIIPNCKANYCYKTDNSTKGNTFSQSYSLTLFYSCLAAGNLSFIVGRINPVEFNPLKTSPEYTRVGVYGKCVL